jgi:hypothetical protein
MRLRWEFRFAAAALMTMIPAGFSAVLAQADTQRLPASAGAAATPDSAAAKPYKSVAIVLPQPLKDASFEAFRNNLVEVARRKDRAALSKLVVYKGFFWERQDGDHSGKTKSGIANLAAALGLDLSEDPDTGWDMISIFAADSTAFLLPGRKDVVCGPADPDFKDDEFRALMETTQTDVSDWIYPLAAGLQLRAAPRTDAPVSETLGLTFLRVLAFDAPNEASNPSAAEFVRVIAPSGKTGFVKVDGIASLGVSQLCYVKEADGWKVAGVLGGVEQ